MTAGLHELLYFIISLFYKIFAHASPYAKISEQVIEKVKSSSLGKLTTWSPQQYILNHPVLTFISVFTSSCPGLLVILTIKLFCRQPDGLFPIVVLIVLLNLLGAASLCKIFLRFILITHLGVYLSLEFAGRFPQTSLLLLHISQKILT